MLLAARSPLHKERYVDSMTVKPDVTFVIVSYNSAKILRGAIESCLTAVRVCYPNRGRVVVYDNASKDSCPEIIADFAKRYPGIFIGIKGEENLGFGKANNIAVAISPSKIYVLVNPDVTFKPEIITKLSDTLNSAKNIAIACPKLLYLDKSVQPSIRRFPTFSYLFIKILLGEKVQKFLHPFDYYYAQMPFPEKAVEINWAIGAFMVISGDYVAQHGLFDERFFLYFEDVSLCVDAWQNGYRVLFEPQVSALHLYQRASTNSTFNYLKLIHMISALKFFAKYRPYQKRWQLITLLLNFNSKLPDTLRLLISEILQKLQKNFVSLR
jgi:GT2 family glycosyltransferase